MADSTNYGRGDAVSRGTSNNDILRAMQDDHLDRLKALAAIAGNVRPRGTVLAHYFSPGDALALQACVEDIERQRELIRQLSERVAICSELLGKRAEKGA